MPGTPDGTTIPIALACEMVDVSRQLRKTWIARRLIRGRSAGACTEGEMLDLCAFATLVERLGFEMSRPVES
jgi:hypothetical protein